MSDLRDLARDLRRLREAIVAQTNDLTREVQRDVYLEAVRRSSGTATEAELRAADHPYARRHGSPLWDPSTINVGRGDFRAAWATDSVPGPYGLMARSVSNRSAVAPFLEQREGATGSSMFARPLEEILARVAETSWALRAPARFEIAFRTVFQS